MAGIGDKLLEIGRSPSQHLGILVFGLVALLTGLLGRSMIPSSGAVTALTLVANALAGIGGFFVTLALFLGAYTTTSEEWPTLIWKVAQLLGAVFILLAIF